MSARYSITEPHPTVKFTYAGRGGAGNIFQTPPAATSTAPVYQGPKVQSSKFLSGRGGAGNVRYDSERPMFSFDEEVARQTSQDEKMMHGDAVYHVGRGGAGNWTSSRAESLRKDSSSSADSDDARSGILSRLSRTFDRQ